MIGWTRVKVEDLAAPTANALATGPFGSSISSKFFVERGVPVIRGSNLSEDVGIRLSDENLVFIVPDRAAKFGRSQVTHGDLVFTCWGTIGQVGLIDERSQFDRYIVSNKQMKLSPDPMKADSLFLYFAFSSPTVMAAIRGQSIGSSVPGFNLGQLRNIELDLPPLGEQRRIAAVLGALDDKIELNRKMNRTLEEMAQALFKSWFIDFDGHDDLVDSEIGPVPRGWEVGTLGKLLELKRGYDLPKRLRVAGDIPIVSSSGHSGWHNESKVAGPGVVAGRYGTIGQVFFVEGDFWPLNTALYVRDFKGGPARWAYHLLRTINWRAYTGKSAVPGVNRNHVHKERVVQPPLRLRYRFDETVAPIWNRYSANERETGTLAALRDTLLPKLISGELRVPEAEAAVEAAT